MIESTSMPINSRFITFYLTCNGRANQCIVNPISIYLETIVYTDEIYNFPKRHQCLISGSTDIDWCSWTKEESQSIKHHLDQSEVKCTLISQMFHQNVLADIISLVMDTFLLRFWQLVFKKITFHAKVNAFQWKCNDHEIYLEEQIQGKSLYNSANCSTEVKLTQ